MLSNPVTQSKEEPDKVPEAMLKEESEQVVQNKPATYNFS